MSTETTNTAQMVPCQLFGGRVDGMNFERPHPVPDSLQYEGATFVRDGYTAGGRVRYSRPQQLWPFPPPEKV